MDAQSSNMSNDVDDDVLDNDETKEVEIHDTANLNDDQIEEEKVDDVLAIKYNRLIKRYDRMQKYTMTLQKENEMLKKSTMRK